MDRVSSLEDFHPINFVLAVHLIIIMVIENKIIIFTLHREFISFFTHTR